ncbi:hypothetical protein N0V93_004398 [Gnomoniopsis smithogilvyi]|uniref:Uncharacterized protein n=1 Tax=Gnomoniopsis smithogilvyi TaxID=1191159 RepID=A0A9W9CX20_9PEZI|nr:hypothetical protein N0V93_004398 [Gnomoniopsis smithogilvyi]
MEQNGHNSSDQHSHNGYGESLAENDRNNYVFHTMSDDPSLTLIDNSTTMGPYQDNTAALDNNEFSTNFVEDGGSTLVDGVTSANQVVNERTQHGAVVGAPGRGGSRGMPAAVRPARRRAARNMLTSHPYTRPQPVRHHAQIQVLQTQRSLSRRNATGDMAKQNATNAYTLPRSRLNATHPQGPVESIIDQIAAVSSSGSVSPIIKSTNTNTRTFESDGGSPGSAKFRNVPIVHHQLDSTRIDPAGPEPHPNPNWRAPGPYQWYEVLYNYTLLVYVSDAGLKDILKHCDRLVGSGVQDSLNPDGPALIDDGQHTVLDAQAVWHYCTAYIKRRQQHRNNSAASRSRNNKASQTKHWKALALAGGAVDRDFVFDKNDPGNAPGAPPDLLAVVTQAAIAEMMNNWAINTLNESQPSMGVPPLGLAPDPPLQYLDQPQIQQQLYGQPQKNLLVPDADAAMVLSDQYAAFPVAAATQTTEAAISMSGPPIHNAAPPPNAVASNSTASAITNTCQPNDLFEENQAEMMSIEKEFVKQLQEFSGQSTRTDDFDFDFGDGNL